MLFNIQLDKSEKELEEKETNTLYGLEPEQVIEDKKVGGHILSLDKSVT